MAITAGTLSTANTTSVLSITSSDQEHGRDAPAAVFAGEEGVAVLAMVAVVTRKNRRAIRSTMFFSGWTSRSPCRASL